MVGHGWCGRCGQREEHRDGLLGVQRPSGKPNSQLWILYGNAALYKLLENMIHEAWRNVSDGQPLPANRFRLIVMNSMNQLLMPYGMSMNDLASTTTMPLQRLISDVPTRQDYAWCCDAIFIDEAQDLPDTLRRRTPCEAIAAGRASKASRDDFLRHAQNVYARPPSMGRGRQSTLVGRSTVMEESFDPQGRSRSWLYVLYRFNRLNPTPTIGNWWHADYRIPYAAARNGGQSVSTMSMGLRRKSTGIQTWRPRPGRLAIILWL